MPVAKAPAPATATVPIPAGRTAARTKPALIEMTRPFVIGSRLPDYKLAFYDDFKGNLLDETKWKYRTGDRLWSANLPANVSVADGMLPAAAEFDWVRVYEPADDSPAGARR